MYVAVVFIMLLPYTAAGPTYGAAANDGAFSQYCGRESGTCTARQLLMAPSPYTAAGTCTSQQLLMLPSPYTTAGHVLVWRGSY